MDVNGVEQVNINAFGGADTITVNDLTGTGVTERQLGPCATPGSGSGDCSPTQSSSTARRADNDPDPGHRQQFHRRRAVGHCSLGSEGRTTSSS